MATNGYWKQFTRRRLSRRRALGTAAALGSGALALSMVGCGGGGGGGTETKDASGLLSKPVDTTSKAVKGGTFTGTSSLLSFDTDDQASSNMALHAMSRVVRYQVYKYPDKVKSEVLPDAASWEISPDGLTYTFKLRPNLKFDPRAPTNGRVMNSADVKWSWEHYEVFNPLRQNLTAKANKEAPVIGFETPNANTFVFKLAYPYGPFLSVLADMRQLPLFPIEAEDKYDIRRDVRGSSAWKLKEYVPSNRIVWEKNPDWYDAAKNNLDGAVYLDISEYTAGLAQFRTGNLPTHSVNQEDVLPMKRDLPQLVMAQVEEFGTGGRWIRFSYLPDSPFRDERVRKANSMLIDRDLFIETFGNVQQFRDAGLDPELRWRTALGAGYEWWMDPKDKEFGPDAKNYFYDPAEAKKLLQAAGHTKTIEYKWNLTNSYGSIYQREAAVLAEMWAAQGDFKANTEVTDHTAQFRPNVHYNSNKFTGMGMGATGTFPDVDGHLQTWYKSGKDTTGHVMPDGKIDQYLDDLVLKQRTAVDINERASVLKELQRYAAKTMYLYLTPGESTGFRLAWPWLGNWGVFRANPAAVNGIEIVPNYWIDSTKRT